VGDLQRVLFQEDGVKDTNWSATSKITGVDGQERRWVYLHCFKSGQPTMNWLDPSFAANRIIAGEIISSLGLGAKILRLDANSFLGVEAHSSEINSLSSECSGKAWSEASQEHPEFPWAHPLSVEVSGNIAMMVRKLGGFTFQELDLSFGAPNCFSEFGADLSYDFLTRTAYFHALLTGNAEFLRIMLDQMHRLGLSPNSLIHALQNHDDITYSLTHLSSYSKDLFFYDNMKLNGLDLKNKLINEMLDIISNSLHSPSSSNGICTTLAGLCAAALQIRDPYKISSQDKSQIKKAHLLAAMFNALQPGVFAFSGWDLVGALPLQKDLIEEFLKDGDNRWINRGSYDLMGTNPDATKSSFGIPKATEIYGNLPAQLKQRNSFASKLKEIIRIRRECSIHQSQQIAIMAGRSPGFISMIHKLPSKEIEITALNFGRDHIEEVININSIKYNTIKFFPSGEIFNLFDNRFEGVVSQKGDISLKLEGLQGKALICRGSSRN
jgi:trehalose synthase